MGTTAEKLQAVLDSKAAIKAAITAMNPATPPTDVLSQWPTAIASIPTGGGDWQKPDDWPDIEQILANDVTPQAAINAGAAYKWIMLCKPGYPGNGVSVYTFSSGTAVYFRISDGSSTVEQAASDSLTITPFDSGVPFWIIVYTADVITRCPLPYFLPYTIVGPLWVHAPDHTFEDRSHNMQSWLSIRRFCADKIVAYTYDCFFMGCQSLVSVDVKNGLWAGSTSKNAFQQAFSSTKLSKLPNLTITSVATTFNGMFQNCTLLTDIDISDWDLSSATTFASTFSGCVSLTSLNLKGMVSSGVTSLYYMFNGCYNLRGIDMSDWDTSGVTEMRGMFQYCYALDHLDVSGFSTGNVLRMDNMFYTCSMLQELDLHGFDMRKVTNVSAMLQACSMLTSLDISGWDCSAITSFNNTFYGDSSLETIIGDATVGANGAIYGCAAYADGSTAYFGKGPNAAVSFSQSTLLGHDSLLFLMYWIADRSATSALTLTLGATNLAKLSADEKAIATAKGWTLA